MKQKRVLMLCCAFPPIGGSGVQRSTKFVKYLPQFGWQPYVVTATYSERSEEKFDDTLLQDIPKTIFVQRVRPNRLPSLVTMTERLFSIISNRFLRRINRKCHSFIWRTIKRLHAGVKWRLGLVDLFIRSTPDSHTFWAVRSILPCLYLIKKYRIDLIYTTSWPFSSHLAGVLLKLLTNRPLVVDFRDPWSLDPNYRNDFRKPINRALEKIVLKRADRVISVNEFIVSDLYHLSKGKSRDKFIVIPNGFDPDDFVKVHNNPRDNRNDSISIYHIGKPFRRNTIPFFKAMELLLKRYPSLINKLFVHFVGGIPPGLPSEDLEYLKLSPIKKQAKIEQRVSHSIAIQFMSNADILLLFVWEGNDGAKCHRGKLFEYMYSNVPILALAPEGVASKAIQETGTGVTLSPSDIDGIADILRQIVTDYEGFKRKYFHPKDEEIAKFDRRKLTQRLAEVFDNLINNNRLQRRV